MAIKKDTLDQLLSGRDPKDVFSKDGLFDELKEALAEWVLNAELDDHLTIASFRFLNILHWAFAPATHGTQSLLLSRLY